MGCSLRLLAAEAVVIQFAPFGWTILLIGLEGGLRSAAIVSADDALTAFFLAAAAAILTLIEAIVPGQGRVAMTGASCRPTRRGGHSW